MVRKSANHSPISPVPPEVLRNRPRRWGIAWFHDDQVLAEPRLIAVRRRESGECQALYQTAINSRTGGRGFIVDASGAGAEHALAAIFCRQGSWRWEFVEAGLEFAGEMNQRPAAYKRK